MTEPCRILIVRLSALGDIVHTLPVAAALRNRYPDARIDWVVDERHSEILDLVPVIDQCIILRSRGVFKWRGVAEIVRQLRLGRYDLAIDVQGLLKSALLARVSGASRVIGFSAAHLRESVARVFYTETHDPGDSVHVIDKNLSLLRPLGFNYGAAVFPIQVPPSSMPAKVREKLGIEQGVRFALLNPGASWSNKRWPSERFGAVALWLQRQHAIPSVVLWGSGDAQLASEVVSASGGAARVAPKTSLKDLVSLTRAAALVISGDTGPAHIATAIGTPVVGLYGPTNALRNGPFLGNDVTVSRFESCSCHYQRRCRKKNWCLYDIPVAEVIEAVNLRLSTVSTLNV